MSLSASASTSTQPPPNSCLPQTDARVLDNAGPSSSSAVSNPQSASPSLPHSPETARQIAEARAYLEASISNIGSSLDSTLKSRAQDLHANAATLDKQEKELAKETDALRRETGKLAKVADEGSRKVKELGNVQNWAEMLERDFLVLGETMRLVRRGERETGWDGGSEWGTESGSGSGSWSGSSGGSEDGYEDGNGHGQEVVNGHERYSSHVQGGDRSLPNKHTTAKASEHPVEAEGKARSTADGSAGPNVTSREIKSIQPEVQLQIATDAEGDITMHQFQESRYQLDQQPEDVDMMKSMEADNQRQTKDPGSSSTTVATASSSASVADPSSSSSHTAISTGT